MESVKNPLSMRFSLSTAFNICYFYVNFWQKLRSVIGYNLSTVCKSWQKSVVFFQKIRPYLVDFKLSLNNSLEETNLKFRNFHKAHIQKFACGVFLKSSCTFLRNRVKYMCMSSKNVQNRNKFMPMTWHTQT